MSASVAAHAGFVVLAVLLVRSAGNVAEVDSSPRAERDRIVFLAMPGPAGGGGGGGHRSATPPRTAQALGRERVNVPVVQSRAQSVDAPELEPVPQLTLAALPMAAGSVAMAGVIEPVSSSRSDSLGAGGGDGVESGVGSGIGSGRGSGLDQGTGGGTGGEVYRAGNGVTPPRLLRSVQPRYTTDAMRARITGTVVLDCIVDANGGVQRCELRRRLDPRKGLDDEAIKAAYQWSFAPGTRAGRPVPVYVTIELTFSIQ